MWAHLPGCAKLSSLYLSKSYSSKLEDIVEIAEDGHQKSKVRLLIERIQAIQKRPAWARESFTTKMGRRSLEAADEQYLLAGMYMDQEQKEQEARRRWTE